MKHLAMFWHLIKPFWCNRQRLPALALLVVVLTLSLSSVWFSVQLNQWNGDFFNALQQLDGSLIYPLLQQFMLIIVALVLVLVYADYLKKKLIIQWREWMTRDLCSRWLSPDSRHYRIQLGQQEPDNPDQRIAEDVFLLVETSLDLLLSFLRSVLTIGSFVVILWTLSGEISIPLGSAELTIPGYMVWVCLLYTLIGTLITHKVGKPLHRLNFQQQKREADFRIALVQRRNHSEAIAGQRGEDCEQQALAQSFSRVAGNWYALMSKERNLAFFTTGYSQVTMLAPIFFALPKFLAGAIQLGGLMQIKMAFTQVASALSWFIYAYKDLARWSATVERLSHFEASLFADTPRPEAAVAAKPSAATDSVPDKSVNVLEPQAVPLLQASLDLLLPDGRPLLQRLRLSLTPGKLLVLHGRSGIGKTSLLRTLAGFWGGYCGKLATRVSPSWISQRLYLPEGSLKSLICYPAATQKFSDERCRQVLQQVGLGELQDTLEQTDNWLQRLSGGEQQRVMFARLLLNAPELILLDETTSALDIAAATSLLQLLRAELPKAGIVLVSHQLPLHQLADEIISLERDNHCLLPPATITHLREV
ncbi:ABC transporter ATP-binding protein/permease [Shewanella indica]|uniref:ABC transporter ATP-binding protein/permease n=1 Tax=Shewanella indica TaxID=768528 RepID=UPI001F2F831C|nr:ABC transporter ATP-binding protein/permease [Shewanella indica]MCE9790878.1 ABC transporter ATP-binding protein/permease [Shewanella indica]